MDTYIICKTFASKDLSIKYSMSYFSRNKASFVVDIKIFLRKILLSIKYKDTWQFWSKFYIRKEKDYLSNWLK